jgi:hypothetical protein
MVLADGYSTICHRHLGHDHAMLNLGFSNGWGVNIALTPVLFTRLLASPPRRACLAWEVWDRLLSSWVEVVEAADCRQGGKAN